jgi:ribonuclease T1
MTKINQIDIKFLPYECEATLKLIKTGGILPYRKDGSIFKNLENVLPVKALGYYREYTVPTPEITTRGDRRLVIGKGGEVYYTSDHYNSFQEVV